MCSRVLINCIIIINEISLSLSLCHMCVYILHHARHGINYNINELIHSATLIQSTPVPDHFRALSPPFPSCILLSRRITGEKEGEPLCVHAVTSADASYYQSTIVLRRPCRRSHASQGKAR